MTSHHWLQLPTNLFCTGREAKEALQGGSFYTLKKILGNIKKSLYPEQPVTPYDPWKLPEISLEDVLEADQTFHYLGSHQTHGTKRKANPSRSRSPAKRTRNAERPLRDWVGEVCIWVSIALFSFISDHSLIFHSSFPFHLRCFWFSCIGQVGWEGCWMVLTRSRYAIFACNFFQIMSQDTFDTMQQEISQPRDNKAIQAWRTN